MLLSWFESTLLHCTRLEIVVSFSVKTKLWLMISRKFNLCSDDDEFYDRTKKKSANKSANTQSVETADSLLDKKEILLKEMEEKKKLLLEEKNMTSEPMVEQDTGDALDAYMSGLSSKLGKPAFLNILLGHI